MSNSSKMQKYKKILISCGAPTQNVLLSYPYRKRKKHSPVQSAPLTFAPNAIDRGILVKAVILFLRIK
jgi:hypothetical protein